MSNKRNKPLKESDRLKVQVILQIEDCYEDLSRVDFEDASSDDEIHFDAGFEQLVVFDSEKDDIGLPV